MKTRIFPGWVWGMVLAGGVVAAGFGQDEPGSGPASVPPEKVSPAVPNPAGPAETGGPAAPSSTARTRLSPLSVEVQKLAQAQVEEGVILAYVTNSPGVFNLTADDIISLKQEGVPQEVLNAMIERDGALLSRGWPVLEAAAPGATVAVASPPASEPQPAAPEESWADESWAVAEPYYAAERPEGAGPVRAPYPVKLNDPIVILKLPSITVPYW